MREKKIHWIDFYREDIALLLRDIRLVAIMDDQRYLLILSCLCRGVQVINQLSENIGHLEEKIEEMGWNIYCPPDCIIILEGDQYGNVK
jgi:hypothetical protein